MEQEEFFRKLKKGEFEGERMETPERLAEYFNVPEGNKVYNTFSENYAKRLSKIFDRAPVFESKFSKNPEKGFYQVGIFYNDGERQL